MVEHHCRYRMANNQQCDFGANESRNIDAFGENWNFVFTLLPPNLNLNLMSFVITESNKTYQIHVTWIGPT